MAKFLLGFLFLLFLSGHLQAQTVYVNQSGSTYHTKACKLYTKNFEAVPLWKAKDVFMKKPCPKCKPPVKEIKAVPKKKPAPAKKAPVAAPPKR